MADLNMTPAEAPEAALAAPTTPETPVASPKTPEGPTPTEVIEFFRQEIADGKEHRRTFSQEWKLNVDLRMGRRARVNTEGYPVSDDTSDEYRSRINPDWYMTKTKTANLFSQTPEVQATHENQQYAAAVAPFTKTLNYELGEKRTKLSVPMEEVLNDVVNAAGVGAAMVGYAARFEETQVPSIDLSPYPPEQQQAMLQSGQVQMQTVQKPTAYKFYCTRLSPTDLLWPKAFNGSDFNDADWVGHTGIMGWSVAKSEFKLSDAVKQKVVNGNGGGKKEAQDDLTSHKDDVAVVAFEAVKFDEIFYWRYKVDPNEKSFKAIWRMVFIHGLDAPVVDEPWNGQQPVQPGSAELVGAMKFPIQFLTLTYISDNAIPPSDSAAARPQVNDLRESRSQYFLNRKRSTPIRWFDVNRTDRTIQDNLMRGDFQGFIPTNGPGDRAIGEIARASYPQEDMAFDRTTFSDLQAMWMMGNNQIGVLSTGEKTKAEIENTQGNFQTRMGQERALVEKFFLNLVDVLAGFIALYSDFPNLSDDEKTRMMQAWDMRRVLGDLVLKIRPDSTIAQDSNQRIEKLARALNLTAKSGVVNIEPVIAEIWELSGVDPAVVMKQPQPPEPPPAQMSYRFTGKEDLYNPVVMGLLVKNGQAPSPEDMQAAEKILLAAQQGVQAVVPPTPQGLPGAAPKPPTNGEPGSQEDYTLMPKVAQRSEDMGNA